MQGGLPMLETYVASIRHIWANEDRLSITLEAWCLEEVRGFIMLNREYFLSESELPLFSIRACKAINSELVPL